VTAICAAALLAGIGTGAWWLLPDRPASPAARVPPGPTAATAVVTRTDLSSNVSLPGNLGFGAAVPISGGSGTVTWLPPVGAIVSRGQPLYRRDDRPDPQFNGSTP
jgi:hypothetical protein